MKLETTWIELSGKYLEFDAFKDKLIKIDEMRDAVMAGKLAEITKLAAERDDSLKNRVGERAAWVVDQKGGV